MSVAALVQVPGKIMVSKEGQYTKILPIVKVDQVIPPLTLVSVFRVTELKACSRNIK